MARARTWSIYWAMVVTTIGTHNWCIVTWLWTWAIETMVALAMVLIIWLMTIMLWWRWLVVIAAAVVYWRRWRCWKQEAYVHLFGATSQIIVCIVCKCATRREE